MWRLAVRCTSECTIFPAGSVAPDGQIEAVSLPEARFVVGVQWHPEYEALKNAFSSALFSAFAKACGAATGESCLFSIHHEEIEVSSQR